MATTITIDPRVRELGDALKLGYTSLQAREDAERRAAQGRFARKAARKAARRAKRQ